MAVWIRIIVIGLAGLVCLICAFSPDIPKHIRFIMGLIGFAILASAIMMGMG